MCHPFVSPLGLSSSSRPHVWWFAEASIQNNTYKKKIHFHFWIVVKELFRHVRRKQRVLCRLKPAKLALSFSAPRTAPSWCRKLPPVSTRYKPWLCKLFKATGAICRSLAGLFNDEIGHWKLLVLTKEKNICRLTGHLRLRPTKGRKPLYWINIKLVQLPKLLTDGGGGPQDVWSEWILRSDPSHPSAPWPWTACWNVLLRWRSFFILLLASKEKMDKLGEKSLGSLYRCACRGWRFVGGGWGVLGGHMFKKRNVKFNVQPHISCSRQIQYDISNVKGFFYQFI